MNLLNKMKEKETWIGIGNGAMKIGKSILIEGTKMTALKGAKSVITTSFDKGLGGVKEMKLDDYLGIEEVKAKDTKPKKKLFGFKKKDGTGEVLEEIGTVVETDTIGEVIPEVDVEIIDKKED